MYIFIFIFIIKSQPTITWKFENIKHRFTRYVHIIFVCTNVFNTLIASSLKQQITNIWLILNV